MEHPMTISTLDVEKIYAQILAQIASESYLHSIDLSNQAALAERFANGNNHFQPAGDTRRIPPPSTGQGATRLTRQQTQEFFSTFEIIDHLPNQSSGFSATLLKNKRTDEYTLAFRSTEYRGIDHGGDAERDSVRGAAGDIAFNGMALTQLSSMESYWASLLNGWRERGATPDDPTSTDKTNLRADLLADLAQKKFTSNCARSAVICPPSTSSCRFAYFFVSPCLPYSRPMKNGRSYHPSKSQLIIVKLKVNLFALMAMHHGVSP